MQRSSCNTQALSRPARTSARDIGTHRGGRSRRPRGRYEHDVSPHVCSTIRLRQTPKRDGRLRRVTWQTYEGQLLRVGLACVYAGHWFYRVCDLAAKYGQHRQQAQPSVTGDGADSAEQWEPGR